MTLLQQIGDRLAIADLITRLGLMLDSKEFGEVHAVLAPDVTVRTPGGAAAGIDAVLAQARRNHTVRTQHVISDVLVDLDGDRAVAGANLIVTFVPEVEGPDSRLTLNDQDVPDGRLTLGERYRFGAVRGDQGWRLDSIEVNRIWSTQPVPAGARVAAGG
ncbi:nuclear transport factor 2 family protein [Pseudonocardia sp. TRM90224]|uniref:nuclear transport factor 2 family protein n=1 Tax=Pseudonocardia sp. TRM90224 TaxID=2812678 RepID=UPI001E3B5DE4|nr:nuclear transport factor 2 family protein [Pseudonocardia sp. TRM90224]